MKAFICFIGYKESGKDTSFELINDFLMKEIYSAESGCISHHMKMALQMKMAVCHVFDFTMDMVQGIGYYRETELEEKIVLRDENLKKFLEAYLGEKRFEDSSETVSKIIENHSGKELTSVRTILEYLGTEVLHMFGNDIHVKISCEACNWKSNLIACTDIRYPIEYEVCQREAISKGYDVWPIYIDNPETTKRMEEKIADSSAHSSERFIPELARLCTTKIINDKGPGGLGRLEADMYQLFRQIKSKTNGVMVTQIEKGEENE